MFSIDSGADENLRLSHGVSLKKEREVFDFYNKQQVSTYARTILQLDNIHRSAMRFIVCTNGIGWKRHDQRDYHR